jgi:hypothetical protein
MGRGKKRAFGRQHSGDTLIPLGESGADVRRGPELETALLEVQKLPQEWASEHGILILDADGWRDRNAPSFDAPCTLAEYQKRAPHCTQMSLEDAKRRGWSS